MCNKENFAMKRSMRHTRIRPYICRPAILFFLCLSILPNREALSQYTWKLVSQNDGCTFLVRTKGDSFIMSERDGIYRSTNNGGNWQRVYSTTKYTGSITMDSAGSLYFLLLGSGFLKSSDDGVSWNLYAPGPTYDSYMAAPIRFNSANHYFLSAGDDRGAIYRSTDGGAHWSMISNSLAAEPGTNGGERSVIGFDKEGNLIAGVYRNGLFLSSDAGASWSKIADYSNDACPISGFFGHPSGVAFCSSCSTMRTDDNYHTWWKLSFDPCCNILFINEKEMMTGYQGGTMYSNNLGATWSDCSQGFPEITFVYSLTFDLQGHILAATSGGVYRSNEIALSESHPHSLAGCSLGSNYPNPASGSTSLEFSIPSASFVQVQIFDMLGRLRKTLFDGSADAGAHVLQADVSALPAGQYNCVLTTGMERRTRMMTVHR
jgi:photosystem II stability/assembly factor-like uncharacterized protein